jgi:hypothetical protein
MKIKYYVVPAKVENCADGVRESAFGGFRVQDAAARTRAALAKFRLADTAKNRFALRRPALLFRS